LQKPTLTPREIDILELIARGLTYDEIAAQLSIALGTVQNHIKSIYRKLAVNSRGRAVFEARKQGLLLNEVFTEPW
jgi:DNA-binding CsgD family transcriptional regulator